LFMLIDESLRRWGEFPRELQARTHRHSEEETLHVEIESGTQVASRGPTWRIATPLV
jgi:hypothetical protein